MSILLYMESTTNPEANMTHSYLTANIDGDQITDCWIVPGSSDNGNILWVSVGSGDMIVGGFRTVAEAQSVATELGWDATIEDF